MGRINKNKPINADLAMDSKSNPRLGWCATRQPAPVPVRQLPSTLHLMTKNALLTPLSGSFTSHRPLLIFHVTTTFSEKANDDWYTDSLTGRLWFMSVSTLKNPKVFALPSNFTDHSLTPAVHLPNAAKATAPGPLCFDQVEANHWSVEQEAAGMAWYGPQWQATRLWALLQCWQSCSFFWPSGCNSFHFRKAHVCIWHSLIIALLRHGYYGNAPWPYSELCQEEREAQRKAGPERARGKKKKLFRECCKQKWKELLFHRLKAKELC